MIFPGIDLGTTYSMIAQVNTQGQPALFPDVHDASQFRTPSLVYIGREGCLVGAAVEELLDDAPELPAARFIKGRLGEADWRYRDHLGRAWTAEALSALILKKLLRDADTFASDSLGPVVVTVPAQFTDPQRQATLIAARLAGLGEVRLIEEPVAAATYYGLDAGPVDRTLLVYDFGGGTFDVTLLQTGRDGLYVLATDGLADVGGRTLDEAIMGWAEGEFKRRHGLSPLTDPATAHRLRRLAEESKIRLSKPGISQVHQPLLLLGRPFEFLLTRMDFDRLVGGAVRRTLEVCERCLQAAGLDWRDVDKILLTGGSSLLPMVTTELRRVSGKPPQDLVLRQPHQAVAFGAAVLAGRLGGRDQGGGLLRQVATADLCLRVWDRQRHQPGLEPLIARNTPLPAAYARTFYTNRPEQTRLILEFVQRRGEDGTERSLGHFAFGPIANPRKNYPVEVTLALTPDGLVRITARDLVNGQEMARVLDEQARAVHADFEEQLALVRGAQVNA